MVAQPKVEQKTLFDDSDDLKEYRQLALAIKKKRVRYKQPTYTKSYEFWHINPDTGEIQYNGDERHIFRLKTLHKLYSFIYGYSGVDALEQFERKEIKLEARKARGQEGKLDNDNSLTSCPPDICSSIMPLLPSRMPPLPNPPPRRGEGIEVKKARRQANNVNSLTSCPPDICSSIMPLLPSRMPPLPNPPPRRGEGIEVKRSRRQANNVNSLTSCPSDICSSIMTPLSNSLPRGERGLVVWGEDKEAEIKGSEMLPIKDRVLLHIKLLRNLRKGLSVEESLRRLNVEGK